MRFWSAFVFCLLTPFFAFSQVDLVNATLLQPTHVPLSSGLESGRYQGTITETQKQKLVKPKAEPKVVDTSISTIRIQPRMPANETKAEAKAEVKVEIKPEAKVETKPEIKTEEPEIKVPSISEQVEDLVSGKGPQMEAYLEQIHPDDSRLNRVELEVGSGIAHSDAKSNSVYRTYSMTAPIMSLMGSFWMTPFLGVSANYTMTLSADVDSATGGTARVPMNQDWSSLNLNFRKYFGMSRKSNYLVSGFSYLSDEMKVASDAPSRARTKTNGFGVHAKVYLPTAPSYTWMFGGTFFPRLSHQESSTALNLQSGTTPEASRVHLMLGGDFRMARTNVFFWDLTFAFEKNQFGGKSNQNEPSGSPAVNTAVTTSSTFLRLGYRWGQ